MLDLGDKEPIRKPPGRVGPENGVGDGVCPPRRHACQAKAISLFRLDPCGLVPRVRKYKK